MQTELHDQLVLAQVRTDDSRMAGKRPELPRWFGYWLQQHLVNHVKQLVGHVRQVETWNIDC